MHSRLCVRFLPTWQIFLLKRQVRAEWLWSIHPIFWSSYQTPKTAAEFRSHCGNYSSNSFSNYILWPTPQQLEIAPTFSLGLVPFTFKPKLVFFQLYRIRPNCSEVLANTSKKVKPATKTVTGDLTRQTLQLLHTFNQVFSDQRMSSVPSFGKCNHIIW